MRVLTMPVLLLVGLDFLVEMFQRMSHLRGWGVESHVTSRRVGPVVLEVVSLVVPDLSALGPPC